MQLLGQLSEGGTLVTHSKAVLQPQPCGEPWEGQGGPSVRLSVCVWAGLLRSETACEG